MGGGLPFGEDGGLIAEFIGDGGVQDFEQVFALLDEAADFGGAAGGFAFVFVLLLAALVNGGEVGLEIGDEVGGQVVGDELRGDAGLGEFLEEVVGGLDGGTLGFIAHFKRGAEAGLIESDGAGGFGDGEEVDADLVDLALLFGGSRAGIGSGLGIVRADLGEEGRQTGEGGFGLAGVRELGGVFATEFGGAFESVVDGVFVVGHMRFGWMVDG